MKAPRFLRDARRTGQSVTEAAMEIGVTHLDRFATSYRRLFGETPSDTVYRR